MPFWCLSCSALQSTSTHAPAPLMAAMQRHTTRASRFHSFSCAPANTRPIATSLLPFCTSFSAQHTNPQRRCPCEISLIAHPGFGCACVRASSTPPLQLFHLWGLPYPRPPLGLTAVFLNCHRSCFSFAEWLPPRHIWDAGSSGDCISRGAR